MIRLYFFIIFLMIFTRPLIVRAQISHVIDGFSSERILGGMGGKRPFIGSFEFKSFPEPLKPVQVDFMLQVNDTSEYLPGPNWEIFIVRRNTSVKLVSDSVFVWSGAHHLGDVFSNSFEFIPLMSGRAGFSFYLHGVSTFYALEIDYCLDIEGDLLALDKRNKVTCTQPLCSFFNQDSIHVSRMNFEPGKRDLFWFMYTVKPLFQVGDTSTITYHLEAIDDIPEGLNIEITTDAMQIITLPDRLSDPISAGDTVVLELKVIPLHVRDVHKVILRFENGIFDLDRAKQTQIACNSVYNNDGFLRIVSDNSLAFIEQKYFPTAFPQGKSGVDERIVIPSDKNKQIIRQKF